MANEYMKRLSKKRKSEAGKKAINARWHPEREYGEATVASTYKDEVDRSRKEASNKFNRGNILSAIVTDKIN